MMAIAAVGRRVARFAERFIPDPFVIAIGLFVVAFALALATLGPSAAVDAAVRGMLAPSLIAFAFQMALILVGGHALAEAPLVRRVLVSVASWPRTTGSAAALVAVVSMALALFNWGLGLVGGALLARAVGEAFHARRAPLDYPLVGAAGYVGLMVWHGGLSGSAPLKVASDGPFGAAIPVSSTIFSPMNLTLTAVLFIVVPLVFAVLGKAGLETALPEPRHDDERTTPPSSRLMRSRVVVFALAVPVLVGLVLAVVERGTGAVTLELVILLMVALGLVVHGSAHAYERAFTRGAVGAAGVLLQFPIYFGVLACAEASGVLTTIARALIGVAEKLPLDESASSSIITFFTAACINVLVPSGGGQWVLQAPILVETAATLDVTREKLVMAFAYGDELTNMLQPFWALPLLSITGLKASELMGTTMLVMLLATPLYVVVLALF